MNQDQFHAQKGISAACAALMAATAALTQDAMARTGHSDDLPGRLLSC